MIADSGILKIEGQNVNINNLKKQELLLYSITSVILLAFEKYLSYHRWNIPAELLEKLDSLQKFIKESVDIEKYEIERVHFKTSKYSEISIVNYLLQFIINPYLRTKELNFKML